jgi:hypothetical protein
MKRQRRWRLTLALAVTALTTVTITTTGLPAGARTSSSPSMTAELRYDPSGTVKAVLERTATLEQLMAEEAAGTAPTARPDHPLGALPAGPEAGPSAAQRAERRAAVRQASRASNAVPEENAPPGTLGTFFAGVDQQAGGCVPPDSDGAVGLTHFVEIVNCRVRVYLKSNQSVVRDVSLQTFFNDTDFVFDPRMVYDQTYRRFVGLVTRRADSGTDTNRYLKLAVSLSDDAAGSWFVFRINFTGSAGEWCDFPQLGLGQNEVLVTCNNFDDSPGGFVRTFTFAIAKARAYNGWGFSFPAFSPAGTFSLAPPVLVQQQQNDNLYFITADDANNQIDMFRMNRGSDPALTTFVKQANIAVPAWSQPFDAFNCGGGGPSAAPTRVDALEGRFQQNSFQNGSSLWNVHSEAIGGFITPVYFQIRVTTNAVIRRGLLNTANTDEFNASIAVNQSNEMFAVWTRTSTTLNPCLAVQRGGCQVAAGDCDTNVGSPSFFHHNGAGPIDNVVGARNRYGDYSTIETDPSASPTCASYRQAWANIESTNQNDGFWDDRVLEFGFC